MNFTKSLLLQRSFSEKIPGGAHTYAKGDDQFPEFMPLYIARGKGSHVWDVDGNEFIEYGMGLRSVTLGHAFEPILNAVSKQLRLGSNFTRPAAIELECAEEFLSIIDGADMVKFCKNGSDATNAAIKLSRAYTSRNLVAICSEHPFFSIEDWFIGTTPMDAGIPQQIKNLTVKFSYNDIESVNQLFAKYPNQIACVILEAEKYTPPENDFLHKLKEICNKNGTVFILDEMITGYRWHLGGAQKKYNIVPDLSTFGKAMGNGFAVSALAGKKELMELGGLNHKKERVFLLSTTHGAETHSLAAAIATIKFYKENGVIERMYEQGEKLDGTLKNAAKEHNLQEYFTVIGPPVCSVYVACGQNKEPSQEFRTLFLQETLKRGILMSSSVISYAHSDKDIEITGEKVFEALLVYKKALNEGVEKYLEGRPVKPTFRKFA